ncbi:MAG: hypothetical protein ACTHV2_05900 [Brachybacterium sp.]|uniref:hypothetical protein n=1 Tax=Brachybacterium sp. TaxID=1891286 RepID=UPI00264BA69D|nr:hypothetical protein [Brachybacterium sp.]MDN6301993.1 hypothetical protein [Brachybacterium sp.]MDN6328787.1 hypothetical protein [Brachybacterium sp.]
MNHSSQRPGPSQRAGSGGGNTPVSPLLVPMLFGGLVIGFLAGYFFVWWGLIAVAAVLVIATSMVLTGRSRDGATGAVAGVLLGYVGILLVALFRGVL